MPITRDQSISFPSRYTWRAAQGGPSVGPGDSTATASQTVTATRTRTGQRLPKWRDVIRQGGNATTPLTATFDSFSSSRVDVLYNLAYPDGSWAVREGHGDVCFATANSVPTFHNGGGLATIKADNFARARFYKRLRALQIQMSGPTFLGELRETIRMIKRPAAALRDSLDRYGNALKNRKRKYPSEWKKKDEIKKVASGLWLENSFGWQPLLNDIKDAVEAYERLTPPLSNRKVISAGGVEGMDLYKQLYNEGVFIRDNVNIHGVFYDLTVLTAKEEVQVRYKGSVSIETESPRWGNAQLFGFTPSEFIPTAWELLPWSFLIDYFSNIGDVISSSVTRTTGVNFVNKTIRRDITVNGMFVPDAERTRLSIGSSWSITGGGNVGYYNTNRKTVARSTGSAVPLPIVRFNAGVSVGQALNMLALFVNFSTDLHPQSRPRRNYRL